MSRYQYYSVERLVEYFINQKKEGDCWDFKQEWHKDRAELIKDIVCFANTVHDENCYLIFGISNDYQVVGMKNVRTKQADIIDTLSNLPFAGDVIPKIEVKTILIHEIEIDILIIYNLQKTPVYLKRNYGKMRDGCIYLRIGDKNTQDNGNADVEDIENLWRKRLGLTKTPLDIIFDRMDNKLEWNERNGTFYNVYRPEYTINIYNEDEDSDLVAEHYAYAMTNQNTSYANLDIQYQNTVLKTYQLVILDGGRLEIPTPERAYICHNQYGTESDYSYSYYILGSDRYKVLLFLYDEENSEQRFALNHLNRVILSFKSLEEKVSFELFIEEHQELLKNKLSMEETYQYIEIAEKLKKEVYLERLHVGTVLNSLLEEWRKRKEYIEL